VLGKELKKSSTSVFLRALAVADNTVLVAYAFYFSFRAIYQHTGFLVEYFEFFQRVQSTLLYLYPSNGLLQSVDLYVRSRSVQ
jgi:hypothetical protein